MSHSYGMKVGSKPLTCSRRSSPQHQCLQCPKTMENLSWTWTPVILPWGQCYNKSKKVDDNERRYCITRKELAAMIAGLKNYRQYLLGRQFIIRTDHAALSYLKNTKDPIGQQARYLDLLSEFHFDLQHRAGIIHCNADALSRKPETQCEINARITG